MFPIFAMICVVLGAIVCFCLAAMAVVAVPIFIITAVVAVPVALPVTLLCYFAARAGL